jgi:hypothetical protein
MTGLVELKSVDMGDKGLIVGAGVTIAELITALGNVSHARFSPLVCTLIPSLGPPACL